jgi:hypothetical protein
VTTIGPFRESVGVTVDTSAVGPFLESKTGAIRKALAAKMDFTTLRLQQIIVNDKLEGQVLNHKTGNLGKSVRPTETVVTTSEIDGGVVAGDTGAGYARALEYGSRAHLIIAVNAKALAFGVQGGEVVSGLYETETIFRKKVMHPGNRAYAFMRGTLDEESQNIQAGFQEAVAEGAAS